MCAQHCELRNDVDVSNTNNPKLIHICYREHNKIRKRIVVLLAKTMQLAQKALNYLKMI